MVLMQYKKGQKERFTKTITESDVSLFAGITGDFNPAHINAEWAKESIFGERIVHGILVTGLISAVIGMKLPGPGAVYMEQDTKFLRPVKLQDTVTAEVELEEILNEEKRILRLATRGYNQKGELVLEGYAVVKAP